MKNNSFCACTYAAIQYTDLPSKLFAFFMNFHLFAFKLVKFFAYSSLPQKKKEKKKISMSTIHPEITSNQNFSIPVHPNFI